jgi:hypothetical protein
MSALKLPFRGNRMAEFVERRKGERRKGPVRSGADRREKTISPKEGPTRSGSDRRHKDRRSGLDRRKAH